MRAATPVADTAQKKERKIIKPTLKLDSVKYVTKNAVVIEDMRVIRKVEI